MAGGVADATKLGLINWGSLGATQGAAIGTAEGSKEGMAKEASGPSLARLIRARSSRSHAGCCGWDCRRQQGRHGGRSRG
jgi:hypothetical protein